MRHTATRRGMVFLLAFAILGLVAFAGPANAGPLSGKLVCAATGFVDVSVPDDATADTVTWSLVGGGVCTGDNLGPYVATISGAGVSTDLGFCDDILVKDLALAVSTDLVSLSNTSNNRTVDQVWFAPLTNFPIATPFFIQNDSGNLAGAGGIFTRFGGKCPPGGIGVANFAWGYFK